MPLDLNPAGKLAKVPASISCRKICVAVLDKEPIKCIKPSP